MLHFYVYTSELAQAGGDVEQLLADICHVAKQRNPARHITGVLFFDKGRFLQVLEGEKSDLDALMVEIERDPRHRNLKYLFREPVKRRSFSQWNMDSLDLSQQNVFSEDVLVKLRDAFAENFQASAGAFIKVARQLLDDPRFLALTKR